MATLAFKLDSPAFDHLHSTFRLSFVTETFRTLLSPPLTSMSKQKHSFTEHVAKHTPPVIYKHPGNPPDIQQALPLT